MSKRIAAMTLTLLVSIASLASAAEPAKATDTGKAPRLTIVEPVKDYGEVPKGDKLNWTFAIKNTGDSDLQILAAKPGCGCTVAEFDRVIKPGETGKVEAHVDTTAFAGPIAKTITVETNDPTAPSATLTIHAVVKPYVEAFPAGFVRFNLLQGETETQSVTLYSEEAEPFQITKVEVPGEWVKATFAKIEDPAQRVQAGPETQAQYRLDLTVGGPEAKLGPLADKVKISTNSKHQPQYEINISGVVRPPFRVEPSGVNFGEVAPTDPAATRSVTLRSNNLKTPESFNVTKAESSTPGIAAAVKPTERKGEYEVTLQVAKDAKPGDLDGLITIYTNDKSNPTVTVPVKAMVKTASTSK